MGDVIGALAGTCTAGDIRTSFEVDDPQTISIVAAVNKQTRWGSSEATPSLGILTTSDNYQLGLVHEGIACCIYPSYSVLLFPFPK